MKKLCQGAGVLASKVFPHNLRHLFARCMKRLELGLEVAEGRGKDKKVSKTLFYRLNKGGRLVS